MGQKPKSDNGSSSKATTSGWVIGLVSATAFVMVVGVYSLLSDSEEQQTQTVQANPSTVAASVTALGRLEPEGEVVNLSSPTSNEGGTGRITKLLVEEGDQVSAGQVVGILDSRDRLKAGLDTAKKEVAIALAQLSQVRASAKAGEIAAQEAEIERVKAQLRGETATLQERIDRLKAELRGETATQEARIKGLEAELENAEREYTRYQKLHLDGVISTSEFESKVLIWQTARERLNEAKENLNKTQLTLQKQIVETQANLNQIESTLQQQINRAQATLEQIAEVRDVDVKAVEAEVERAIAAVSQAQAELEFAFVRSPIDGRILKIHTRPGERVGDDGIVEVGNTDQMYVVAEVYETDIGEVRIGQRAVVTSEHGGFEGELQGTVDQIGLRIGKQDVLDSDPVAAVDASIVEVKIRLDESDSKKVFGLTNLKVRVRIEI